MSRGKFVSFEGIDNAGKGTQIKLLEAYLREKKISCMSIREPGGTALGEILRRIIKYPQQAYSLFNKAYAQEKDFALIPEDQQRTPEAELLLFLAPRAELMRHVILPNLEKGVSVIADRLGDSTRAYQGGGRFHSSPQIIQLINQLNDFVLKENWPDKTFFLDISYEVMLQRSKGAKLDYMEKLGEEFFERTRREYQRIALENPKRVVSLDGALSPERIFKHGILPHINQLYGIQ